MDKFQKSEGINDFDLSEENSIKSGFKNFSVAVICIILASATVVCSAFAMINLHKAMGVTSPDEPTTSAVISTTAQSESFEPFSSLTISYRKNSFPQSGNNNLMAVFSENSDVAGWLTIDGTAVDFPIVQKNNNKYYLSNHNAYNKSAHYGTPFLDYRCNKSELSKNTVIYGHHMKNGSQFGLLELFSKADYCKKHPVIRYETINGSHIFKIYAVFYTTTQGSSDNGFVFDYYNPDMSDDNFEGYIQLVNQYALYTTDAMLSKTDKIITLSTCAYVYNNLKKGKVDTRFVVVGRLLREGETCPSETKITPNPDYRRPQLWYDKKGKENPYSAYRSWRPSL